MADFAHLMRLFKLKTYRCVIICFLILSLPVVEVSEKIPASSFVCSSNNLAAITQPIHLPLVTIIIPTFNMAKTLPAAIQSALGQSYKNVEILIIDDGSTDDTEGVVQSFTDARIQLIKNTVNLKRSGAINRGIDLSRGEFIVFLDADDSLPQYSIATRACYLTTHPKIDIVYSQAQLMVNGITGPVARVKPAKDLQELAFRTLRDLTTPIYQQTAMFRRHVFDRIRFDLGATRAEDHWLIHQLEREDRFQLSFLDEITYYYVSDTHGRKSRLSNRKKALITKLRLVLSSKNHFQVKTFLFLHVTTVQLLKFLFEFFSGNKLIQCQKISLRLADIFLSAILIMVFFVPIFILLYPFIRVNIGSPVLFSQERVGQWNRGFQLYKLRSMKGEIRNGDPLDGRNGSNNDRLTWLGKWLRRTKIDELPQLWNVLKGEMSLVGWRPPQPNELEKIRADFPAWSTDCLLRHKPGLTSPVTLTSDLLHFDPSDDAENYAHSKVQRYLADAAFLRNLSVADYVKTIAKTGVSIFHRLVDNAPVQSQGFMKQQTVAQKPAYSSQLMVLKAS